MAKEKEFSRKIIKDCEESGLTYGEIMEILKEVRWYFMSRAETFLKDTQIREVSANEHTPCIQNLTEGMV